MKITTVSHTCSTLRIILILLVLHSIVPHLKSQTLLDTGKTWYVVEGTWQTRTTSQYKFANNIIIDSVGYKQLLKSTDSTGSSWINYDALREDSTGKIFRYNQGKEQLIYNFNLAKNDTFKTEVDYECPIQLVVDSIDMITLLNGEKRKRIIFNINAYEEEEWIEGIGSLNGLLNVGYKFCSADLSYELNCFEENDTLKYHNQIYPTCTFYDMGISQAYGQNSLTIHPNPTSDELYINQIGFFPSQYFIYNIQGQGMAAGEMLNQVLSTKGLQQGIYLLKITDREGNNQIVRFIKM